MGVSPDVVLRDLLSPWDATLLLFDDVASAPALDALSGTNLVPRVAFGLVRGSGLNVATLWSLQLGRLISHTAASSHRLHARIPIQAWKQLRGLPPAWQRVVHTALANPQDWDSDRMAAACCTTRRTLERHLRRLGLPSPAALLPMV